MKNLQNFGVQELSIKEVENTSGGGRFAKFIGWCYGTAGRYYLAGGAHTQYGL
tara:strand:+ start:541 stop:699 length:159 start_codon:yes stop_codon:yes gene_type:complete